LPSGRVTAIEAALEAARADLGVVTSRANAGGVQAVQWSLPGSGVYSLCTLLCRQLHQFGPALPCPKSMFR
jgi:hypothetical protein